MRSIELKMTQESLENRCYKSVQTGRRFINSVDVEHWFPLHMREPGQEPDKLLIHTPQGTFEYVCENESYYEV